MSHLNLSPTEILGIEYDYNGPNDCQRKIVHAADGTDYVYHQIDSRWLIHPDMAKPVRSLSCTCCGGWIERGRQWWNQDTGYGICVKCVAWIRGRNRPEDNIHDLYGVEGVHWGLPENQANKGAAQ